MKKVFYLSTCNTCKRIINQLQLKEKGFELMDIKPNSVSLSDIEWLKQLANSYEVLFSKTARKYRELGLATESLSEQEYKNLILQEYTFLKRPVIVYNNKIFIGNAPKTIVQASEFIQYN